ncbi:MAG: hypothetical protein AAF600_20720, partial [Bacteroidota bacterium]
MLFKYQNSLLNSIVILTDDYHRERSALKYSNSLINIFWNRLEEDYTFLLDGIPLTLQPGQITTSTYLQQIEFDKTAKPLTAFSFNR